MAVYQFTPAPGENSRQFQVIAEPDNGASLWILGVRATRTRGGKFSVEFNLTQPAAVTAEVKDASGRTVARLAPFGGRAVEGWQSLTWRGTDEAGVHLPSRAYLLTLTASDEEGRVTRATIPVVLTRWEETMRTLTMILGSCGGGGGGGGVSDTTPPTISCLAVQPDAPIVPGSRVRVEADVSDDLSGVQSVTVQVTYPDGSTAAHTLSLMSGEHVRRGVQRALHQPARHSDLCRGSKGRSRQYDASP